MKKMLMMALLAAGPALATELDRTPLTAVTADGQSVRLFPNGRWEYVDQAKAAAFRPTWEVFKSTREGEIIPHLYAGRVAEAKAIAGGIQAERMKQMRGVMACK